MKIMSQTWQEQLFLMFDKNTDKAITYRELIIGCAPDSNNDGVISETEFNKGKSTAIKWLANILCAVPNALSDNKIDLVEIYATSRSNNCIGTVDVEGNLKPSQEDINTATNIINNITF